METIESLKAVPYELVIVPAKPSADMIAVGDNMIMQGGLAEEVYAEMLNAAPVHQSAAVAVPDWVIDAIERQFCSEIDCVTPDTSCCMKDLKDSVNFLRGMSVEPTRQRVTEQDAREIVTEFDSWNSTQYSLGSYNEWYKAEGRALLAKLNGVTE